MESVRALKQAHHSCHQPPRESNHVSLATRSILEGAMWGATIVALHKWCLVAMSALGVCVSRRLMWPSVAKRCVEQQHLSHFTLIKRSGETAFKLKRAIWTEQSSRYNSLHSQLALPWRECDWNRSVCVKRWLETQRKELSCGLHCVSFQCLKCVEAHSWTNELSPYVRKTMIKRARNILNTV